MSTHTGDKTQTRRAPVSNYYRFSIFNVVSLMFLAGNIITLYALRFNASTIVIGLISASYQANLVFTLLGRVVVPRIGAVRTWGYGWILRYVCMLPVLLTQIPSVRARPNVVLLIVVLCAWCFSLAKGIGITGTKPVVGELAPHGQLGKIISTHHLIINLGMIVTGLVVAFALGAESPIGRYGILLSLGVASGLMAAVFILRLPEPRGASAGYAAPFLQGIRRAMAPGPFRKFSAAVFGAGFSVAMVQAFLVVFLKVTYGYSDSAVVFFAVAGSVGGMVMALISRAVADKIGSKILFFVYSNVIVVVCVAVALAPPLPGALRYIFPAAIYFLSTMGQFGIFNTTEVYFYSVTAAEHRLDLGIIAGLAKGVAGLLGSFLGGLFLASLQAHGGVGSTMPFRVYFIVAASVMIVALVQIVRLSDAGAPSMRQTLETLLTRREGQPRR